MLQVMAKKEPPKKTVTIRAKVDDIDKIDEMAEKRRWTRSEMCDYAIEQFVKRNHAKFMKTGKFEDE